MSKLRYHWWGYAKGIVTICGNPDCPKRELLTEAEISAYNAAVAKTLAMKEGEDRMKLIRMVMIARTHTIAGAALRLYISERTARQWHGDFIRLVGEGLGLKVCTPAPENGDTM
jgi:hypothetical protein